jgi:hypothetical protein
MEKTREGARISRLMAVILAVLFLAATAAIAQDEGDEPLRTRDRERSELRDGSGDPSGPMEQFRQRLERRIQAAGDLDEAARHQMRENLAACLRHGVDTEDVEAIFPAPETPGALDGQTCLRLQNRVVAMLEGDLPCEPLLAKVREGMTKRVAAGAIEGVATRLEQHVRQADRVLGEATKDGLEAPQEPQRRREMAGELAQHMFRGLGEGDCDQLRERARLRLRDGSCELEDLAAAAATTMRMREEGVAPRRALEVAGEALQAGYNAREMRELAHMVMASHRHGADLDEIMDGIENGLGDGMGAGEMYRHMMQQGWMGPADMPGPGGHSPGEGQGGGPGDEGPHGPDHGPGDGMGGPDDGAGGPDGTTGPDNGQGGDGGHGGGGNG